MPTRVTARPALSLAAEDLPSPARLPASMLLLLAAALVHESGNGNSSATSQFHSGPNRE